MQTYPVVESVNNYREYPWDPSTMDGHISYGGDLENGNDVPVEYAIDQEINSKMFLMNVEAWRLVIDAAVIGSNESLNDRTEDFQRVLRLGGREVVDSCSHEHRVRTGNAAILRSGQLPCDHLIVAIGPKFIEKYASAAENALSAAVRNALQLAFENDYASVLVFSFFCLFDVNANTCLVSFLFF